ncbi:class I SAM-dependent rRNA methyltransferase [Desulfohalobiaceae bacterium Ax17]|uniref:class I SAM-dependent rRNA methyltransferase n=1 Tax=Desulfovulcanus ferrireducens TaxID=2831190 RepID=UPI00207BB201|nr:class I SAM-dependent rRNA methyltransferase [Desulfovulcanus ferrireducens]
MKKIYLKKDEDRRIKAGHLWVFSNEINTQKVSLKKFQPGEEVHVLTHTGNFLASGYINPHSLISVRILSRNPKYAIPELIASRIVEARALRQDIFSAPYFRLVFAESDFLPGLIVDQFQDILSVQLTTAGMDTRKDLVEKILINQTQAKNIVWKNDLSARTLEGLDRHVKITGQVPEQGFVIENDHKFIFPLMKGQKTGWFYDQRDNRQKFARFCTDKNVLDVFSYVGAMSIYAAKAGARQVLAIDSSKLALDFALENSLLNGVNYKLKTICSDAVSIMEEMVIAKEKFQAISIDPPAFIKRKKDKKNGLKAYLKVNDLGIKLLAKGGYLMTCSCSQHLSLNELINVIRQAAQKNGRFLRIIQFCHQGPDHPVHPAMHETNYLKGLICQVM